MARKVHNWPAVRKDYVEGISEPNGELRYPTLDEVADRHGIGRRYARNVAASESWVDRRSEFIAKLEQARSVVRTGELAKAGAQFDSRCLAIANGQMDLCAKVLAHLQRDNRVPEPLELVRVTNAFRLAQIIGKVALGEADGGTELVNPLAPHDGSTVRTFRVVYERRTVEANGR